MTKQLVNESPFVGKNLNKQISYFLLSSAKEYFLTKYNLLNFNLFVGISFKNQALKQPMRKNGFGLAKIIHFFNPYDGWILIPLYP